MKQRVGRSKQRGQFVGVGEDVLDALAPIMWQAKAA
jgi:hypothetical protein